MSDLAKLQQAFHQFLKDQNPEIESLIIGKNAQEVKRRLEVYRGAYELRLEDNLRNQYPVLAAWLKEDFEALTRKYRKAYPPIDFSIRHYGKYLAEFLQKPSEHTNFLAELAQFEWAMNVALDDSAEQDLLTIQALQQLTPEQLMTQHFAFHPSLQLLAFDYDIPPFWQAAKKQQKLVTPQKHQQAIYCVVWRKSLLPYFRVISDKEHALYQAVLKGADFTGLCEAALPFANEDEAPSQVVSVLLQWLTDGWCCKI